MTDTTTITIKVKKDVKKNAIKFFDSIGCSLNDWIGVLINNIVTNSSINSFDEINDSDKTYKWFENNRKNYKPDDIYNDLKKNKKKLNLIKKIAKIWKSS